MRPLFVMTTLLLATMASAGDDISFMPPAGTIGAWKKIEKPRVFTQADLYGYIDGGAELFLEFGFEQLTIQRYVNGSDELTIEIYRMRDPIAARGIYLMRCGNESPQPGFRERHTANRYQLIFQRNRYYITINNSTGNEKWAPDLVATGIFVASKLPPDEPVRILDWLPPQGLIKNTARLIRGPVALQSVYSLGEGDMLQLGGDLIAVSGAYAGKEACTLIITDYPNPASAQKAFYYIQEHLDSYLKPSASKKYGLVFKDYEGKFGTVAAKRKRLTIRVHLVTQPL